MNNPNRRISLWAWLIAIVFLIGIFVPGWLGVDGMDGGFALSTFSLVLCLTAVITAILTGKLTRQQEALFAGKELLARWSYTPEEWARFSKDEMVRDEAGKMIMLATVAFFAVLCGAGFWIMDPEDGKWVAFAMLGLIVVIGFTAWLSIRLTRHHLMHRASDSWISRGAAYVGRQMHSWTLVGSSLSDVSLIEMEPDALIEIDYRGGKTDYSVRIPVPEGKQEEAKAVVLALLDGIKE